MFITTDAAEFSMFYWLAVSFSFAGTPRPPRYAAFARADISFSAAAADIFLHCAPSSGTIAAPASEYTPAMPARQRQRYGLRRQRCCRRRRRRALRRRYSQLSG